MNKQKFKITVSNNNLLSWEERDILLKYLPDADIRQRKHYSEYYHRINDEEVELSFEDIDDLSVWFKVVFYNGYNLYLEG